METLVARVSVREACLGALPLLFALRELWTPCSPEDDDDDDDDDDVYRLFRKQRFL